MDLSAVVQNIGAFTEEAIVVADADLGDGAVLELRWVNPAFCNLTGYSSEEVLGQTLGILAGPNTDNDVRDDIIARLTDWSSFSTEIVCHRKHGSYFWGQLSFQPIADENGVNRFWICLIRDITQQRVRREKMADLALIAQNTRDMVAIVGSDKNIAWVNKSFTEFTGYAAEDALGKRLSSLLEPEDIDPAIQQQMVEKVAENRTFVVEGITRRKDGTRFMASTEIQPVQDGNGKLLRYVVMIRDITTRRVMEMRYKAVFDETNSAISMMFEGRYLMVNSQFARAHGKEPEWFVDRKPTEFMTKSASAELATVEQYVLSDGKAVLWERTRRRDQADGAGHYLTKTFRVYDPVLRGYLICSVETEITDIRRTEQRLRQSQKAAKSAEKRLRGALDSMTDGFVLYDARDRIVMSNPAFDDMHEGVKIEAGMTFTDLVNQGLAVGLWDLDGKSPRAWASAFIRSRDTEMAHGKVVHLASGRWMLCKEIMLETGERVGLRMDMTEVKEREAALTLAQIEARRAESRLKAAVFALDDTLVLYDSDDRLILHPGGKGVLPSYAKEVGVQIGMKFEEIIRKSLERGMLPDAIGREEEWLQERLERHRNPKGPIEERLSDGTVLRILEHRTEMGDTVAMVMDVTEVREQQRVLETYAKDLNSSHQLLEERNRALEAATVQLEHSSRHDPLTGLPNRRYLDEELIRRSAAAAENNRRFAVLHLDLDRFKQINDTFGHTAGDEVLNTVATILREETRGADFAARVGGDEFVILCDFKREPLSLGTLAERIIRRISTPIRYDGQDCRCGCSIGIAVDDSAEDDPRQVLVNADIALYRAKAQGRNRWAFFSQMLAAEIVSSKRLSDDILRALDRGEFTATYQPQFKLSDGSLAGAEALLRWHHPERGVLHPSAFIGAAEDLNVIRQIDQGVLRQVMEDDARWRAAGLLVPKLSVNVSGRRLRDPTLIQDISKGGIDPSRISVEVLESIFIDDADDVLAWNIDQLRDMGVGIELDDFGTGHSSIVGLVKLKPQRLKIDRQFIDRTLDASESATLLASIVGIGHSLGVEVVAEGVETAEQDALLRRLGCDVAQGYFYARPMPAQDLQPFIASKLRMLADS